MMQHDELSDRQLRQLLRTKGITLAGNRSLRIYGTLNCKSGKRMKRTNRVFFKNETEALREGFRPCGHCMRNQYKRWKASLA